MKRTLRELQRLEAKQALWLRAQDMYASASRRNDWQRAHCRLKAASACLRGWHGRIASE